MIIDQEQKIFTLEGDQDKELFFEQAGSIVTLISQEDYQQLVGDSNVPETIAWFDYQRPKKTHGKYTDLTVYINESKLDFPWMTSELKSKISQVIMRHEIAEFWYIYEGKYRYTPKTARGWGNSLPHYQALLEEWRLAFDLDCALEYMECIRQWARQAVQNQGQEYAESFLLENEQVFALVAEEFGKL